MKKVTFEAREKLDFRIDEAYKSLRTNVQFCGSNIRVISFTSCTPNEGKSSVSFNLAVSFAESGKKVIMIDADMRKSVLAGRYKVGEVESGLAHYLAGQKSLDEVCMETDIEGMDIIFSGPYVPNPAELLESDNFHELVQYCREKYDYVLIDTPPLGSVIDSAIVAKEVDGAILVVEADAISYHFVQNVKNQLDKSNVKILGTVLNKVPMGGSKYGKYGYGKYGYGKYGSYGRYGRYGQYGQYGQYGDYGTYGHEKE
jgi:capsular exopolysaccharide synthesis family protein